MNVLFAPILQRVLLAMLLGLAAVLLTGCWDRTEVNDLALVTAAGLDKGKNNRYEMSVQLFLPKSPGGSEQSLSSQGKGMSGVTIVRKAEGTTIAEAISLMQELLPRRIFWGHDKVFIIGDALAREGIREHVDYLMRLPQIRESAYVYVSKGKVEDILEYIPHVERSSAEMLREMAKSQIQMRVTLKDLCRMLNGDSQAAALPWVDFKKQPQDPGIPYITGTAIFKGDKLIGHIDDQVTRGVLWVRDEMKKAVVTVKPKEVEGLVSMELIRSKSKLLPKLENGKWTIIVKAETEDNIIQNGTTWNMMDANVTNKLEVDMEQEIEDKMNKALKQVQKKMKADIFGFADAFHRSYPKQFAKVKDHWSEVLPQIEVNFEVKARVRRPGSTNLPMGVQKVEGQTK